MKAGRLEYRFRFLVHAVIYTLAFWAPWNYAVRVDGGKTLWEWAALRLFTGGWLRFEAASVVLLVAATVFAALGAWFRVWGTAYLGAGTVHSAGMHGENVVADGPYRYVRNPLYLGTILFTVGLTLIMPPSGALFGLVAVTLEQLRLVGAEEVFLRERMGEAYGEYCRRVPRMVPALTPQLAGSGARPRWVQAVLGEVFMVAVAVCFATVGWRYNSHLLVQCVMVSLGVWMVVRALLPKRVETV
jgi:protein-S-isoprenylcysteine O-methyltransferase Ste14